MTYLEKFKALCRQNPQRIVFAEANDERVITAARLLFDQGLAIPILLGGGYEVRDLAAKINITTRGLKIVNPNHDREIQPYINQLIRQNKNKKLGRFEAGNIIKRPITQSLYRLICGHGDIAFAGNNSDITQVLSTGIKWSGIKKGFKRVASFYLMFSQDNKDVFAFADCSINVVPNSAQLAEIAFNTASGFQMITGRVPRIAFLSFSTKGSAKHSKVDIVREAVDIFIQKKNHFICDGELQFDAAVDQGIAQKKTPGSSLNGNTNVFIFPSLNSANIAQKMAVQLGGYTAIGPMVQGLNNPLHPLSKSCTIEEIINSVLLASVMKIKTD